MKGKGKGKGELNVENIENLIEILLLNKGKIMENVLKKHLRD